VTLRTRHGDVSTGQSESRGGVVELGAGPLDGRMARLTIRWESRGDVVRICSLLEIGQVARNALGGSSCELVVHVALRTCDVYVGTSQRESRGGVIEFRARPLHGGVAGLAS
jgi:hypothetical protein